VTDPAGPTGFDLDGSGIDGWARLTETQQAQAVDLARMLLWAATGRRFGVWARTVRPALLPRQWEPRWPYSEPWALMFRCCGQVYCVCGRKQLLLPGPVVSVDEVRLNGAVLVADVDYGVRGDYLVKRVGAWPMRQHLARPDTEHGTFSVAFHSGEALPPGGVAAGNRLLRELVGASCGDDTCLPENVTQIQREGITIDVASIETLLVDGKIGVPEVDAWIAAVNPAKLRADSDVWSPDLPRMYRA
jgi:hypothetical protein